MNEYEQAKHEHDDAADYMIEVFLDGPSEDEIQRFQHTTDRGPFGGSSGGAAASEVMP